MDLLIGVDYADLHSSFVEIRGKVSEPVARLGSLGWTCIGRPDGRVESGTRTHTIRTMFTREVGPISGTGGCYVCCELDQTLKRFWEIESYGTQLCDRIVCAEEEKVALEKVSSSVCYNSGRYSVAVPLKKQKPQLPNKSTQFATSDHRPISQLNPQGIVPLTPKSFLTWSTGWPVHSSNR